MSFEKINIEVSIQEDLGKIWHYYTDPEHVKMWNYASEDWYCPTAMNNLYVGGRFNYRMSSTDDQMGFDFEGEYLEIVLHEKIRYKMNDAREVCVVFKSLGERVQVAIEFDAERENPLDMQKSGWQAILNNFKKYAEA